MEVDARLRLRAARYVASLALRAGDDPMRPGVDAAQLRRAQELTLHAALEVYVNLGVLNNEEATEWRQSAADAAGARGVVRRTGDPERARALLEQRLADARTDEGNTRFALALSAVRMAGALGPGDDRIWHNRARERIVGRAAAAQERRELARRQCRADDLQAVICGPATRESGLCVATVELYADAVLVTWRMPWSGHDAGPMPRMRVTDDLDTEYLEGLGGGAGGGTPRPWVGRSVAVPAPPPAVTRLELELGRDRFEADLRSGVVR